MLYNDVMEMESLPALVTPRKRREGKQYREGANGRSLKEIQLSLRRAKVAELALKGWTQESMSEFFNLSVGTVANDLSFIRQEWARERLENVDLYVRQEIMKLDTDEHDLRRRIMTLPDSGIDMILKVYGHLLRIMQRRAKMLGLDQPTKLSVTVDQIEVVVQQIIAVVIDEVHDPEQRERIGHRIIGLIAPHTEEKS